MRETQQTEFLVDILVVLNLAIATLLVQFLLNVIMEYVNVEAMLKEIIVIIVVREHLD